MPLSQDHVRLGGKCRKRGPKSRQQDIIGIEKKHPIAARGIQPSVARRTRAAVWAVQRTDARVLSGKRVAKGAGIVGAAIVHQQQLQPGGGIGQCACGGAAQRGCGLVAGNDDRNVAYAHGCSSCRIVL